MIDTIHIKIKHPAKQEVVNGLSGYHHTAYQNGHYSELGRLGNLRVSATHEAVKVFGSLAVFKNGNNVAPFGFADTESALVELAKKLGVPFGALLEANVLRLDVGANLDMKLPVSGYLRALADPCKMTRLNYRHQTATFIGDGLTLNYYDKGAETIKKNPDLAPLVAERNLLRYEVQFTARLRHRFGREVKVETLLDPGFHHRLRQEYVKHHEQRIGRLVPVMQIPMGVRRLNAELAWLGVEAIGGEEQALAMIAETHQKQATNRSQRARLASYVRGLRGQSGTLDLHDVMSELGEAIRTAASKA